VINILMWFRDMGCYSGVHDPYHPAQGGQDGYIIGGGPHGAYIGGPIEK
jgi:hypothetical protein